MPNRSQPIKLDINGTIIKMEKEFLLKSEYFRKLLGNNWDKKRKRDQSIKIIDPNIDTTTDRSLKLIFTIGSLAGELPIIDEENCLIYFEYANYFMIDTLSDICCNYIINNLNRDSIITYLETGFNYGLNKKMYSGCLKYFKDNIYDTKFQDYFFQNQKLNINVLLDIFGDTNLWFRNEFEKYQLFKLLFLNLNTYLKDANRETQQKIKNLLENWYSSINYAQFSGTNFMKIITDKLLTMDQIVDIASKRLSLETPLINYFWLEINNDFKKGNLLKSKKLKKKKKMELELYFFFDNNCISFYIVDKQNYSLTKDINITFKIMEFNSISLQTKPNACRYQTLDIKLFKEKYTPFYIFTLEDPINIDNLSNLRVICKIE